MKTAILWLIVGLVVQGLWMQWRFTGTFTKNIPRPELCEISLIKDLGADLRILKDDWLCEEQKDFYLCKRLFPN